MTKSVPWGHISSGFDAHGAAREAARRAGVSVAEWLEQAIAEQAAYAGLDADELTEDEKVEAIVARLETLAEAEPVRAPRRRRADGSPSPAARRQTDRFFPDMHLLDAAASRLEQRPDGDDPVHRVARRLAEIESALTERAPARRREARNEPLGEIEGQLRRIAERLRAEAPAPARTRRAPAGLERIEDKLNTLLASLEPTAPRERASPKSNDDLQTQLSAIRSQMGELDHASAPAKSDVARLRTQIEELARAIEIIGARANAQGVEPALKELLARIDESRSNGVTDAALAPVVSLLNDIGGTLKASPLALTRAMADQIEHVYERLDAQARGGLDTGSFTAIKQQTETIARTIPDIIGRLTSHEALERQIKLLSARIEDIARAPHELAERLVELVEEMRLSIDRLDANPALRALERRLEDLSWRGEDMSPALAATLEYVRSAIDGLADHPAFSAIHAKMAELAAQSSAFPTRLLETLSDLRQSIERMASNPALLALEERLLEANARATPLPGHITESLVEIRLAIERLAANAGMRAQDDGSHALAGVPAKLESIEKSVTQLSEKIDAAQFSSDAPIIERLSSLQDVLVSRLDRMRSELPGEQIAGLLARVEDVHRAMEQPQLAALPEGRLEDLVAQLATKLERASATESGDPRALQALENQVLRIAERLDRNGETVDAISSLERSMGDLFTQVEETRHAASEAAGGSIGDAIARDLSSLRAVQDEADRRTQATLNAVHETLEKVVDRLAYLEGDVGTLRAGKAPPAPVPVPMPVSVPDTAAPIVAPGPASLLGTAAPEVLIEPGSGFTPTAPARQDLAMEFGEPRSAQKSFIAAARRASQMLAGATPAPRAETRNAAAPDREFADARTRARAAAQGHDEGEETGGLLGDKARTIMLSLAGLVLLAGAYQIVRERPAASTTTAKQPNAIVEPATAEPREATDMLSVGTIAKIDPTTPLVTDLAKSGNVAAQYELATRLVEGRGMLRDAGQAIQWFRKAADQNYAPAQYRLGALFEKGAGTQRSGKTAALWYGKAAEAGHVRAMHNLGVLLADGIDGKPDYDAAAQMFRKAAEHGVRDSQFNLAVLHVRGLGVPQDLAEAYKWFSLAVTQGDSDALAKRDEIAQRMQPRQLTDARRATEAFALRKPNPLANDPAPLETILNAPRASAQDAPDAPARGKTQDRVTQLK